MTLRSQICGDEERQGKMNVGKAQVSGGMLPFRHVRDAVSCASFVYCRISTATTALDGTSRDVCCRRKHVSVHVSFFY